MTDVIIAGGEDGSEIPTTETELAAVAEAQADAAIAQAEASVEMESIVQEGITDRTEIEANTELAIAEVQAEAAAEVAEVIAEGNDEWRQSIEAKLDRLMETVSSIQANSAPPQSSLPIPEAEVVSPEVIVESQEGPVAEPAPRPRKRLRWI